MINPAGRESRGVGVGLDHSDEIPDPRGQSGGDDVGNDGGGRVAIAGDDFDPPPASLPQSAEEGDGGDSLLPVQRSATPLPGEAGVDHASLPFANYGGGNDDGESGGEFIFQPFYVAPELATVGEHWRDTTCLLLDLVAEQIAESRATSELIEPRAQRFISLLDETLGELQNFVGRAIDHYPKLYVWLPGVALCRLAASAGLPLEDLRRETAAAVTTTTTTTTARDQMPIELL